MAFDLKSYQYKRMLEERRGKNFEYWTPKHDEMLNNGWQIADLPTYRKNKNPEYTIFLDDALLVVREKRNEGCFARIVCGYQKDAQRVKYYTVIFKPKQQTPATQQR